MFQNKKNFKCVIDGTEKEFEILYTFKSFKTNKDYIIYTDNTYDEKENLNIYSSIYYPQNSEMDLENIENGSDWNEIEKFLNEASGDDNE